MFGFISLIILLKIISRIRAAPTCGENEEWDACGACDENCYTVSVALPIQMATKPVSAGTSFEISGYLPENIDGTQFTIEFRSGDGAEDDNKIFHFNPRALSSVILNTYEDEEWGEEEEQVYSFAIGRPFILTIDVLEDAYEISIDGRSYASYKHRLSVSDIKYIFIDGEVRIQNIFQYTENDLTDLLEKSNLTTINYAQRQEIYSRWQEKFEKELESEEELCKSIGRCRCQQGMVRHDGHCIPADKCRILELPELPTCPKEDPRFINYDVFKMHTRTDPTCKTLDNFTISDHCGPPGCQCYSPVFVREESSGRCIPRWDCDRDLGYYIPECHDLKCGDGYSCEMSKVWKCWGRTCFPMIACGAPGVDSHTFIFPECEQIECPTGYKCQMKNASFSFQQFEDVVTETPLCLKIPSTNTTVTTMKD